ncbi:MAG: TolC family protein [Actinomycetota bacterium]
MTVSTVRLATALVLSMAAAMPARAESVRDTVERMLQGHKRLAAALADERAADSNSWKARGGYFPDLKLSADKGRQHLHKGYPNTSTDLVERQAGVSLTQNLIDFGKTDAEVDKADLSLEQTKTTVSSVRQDLILEGVSSYINLHRAYRSLSYAEQSVANIRRQTGLEESRVELGAGMPTDVLQAKSELAGAEARLVQARGNMVAAVNRFRAVFGENPPPATEMAAVPVPLSLLPPSLDDAVVLAQNNNYQLRAARLTSDIAQAEVRRVIGAELAPKLNAVAESKVKVNVDGTVGNQQEHVLKLEVAYPLNLGFAPVSSLNAARESVLAADNRHADTRDVVEEQVRNAWQALSTAREKADYLENQARISAEFLRMAREERLHGRRSLIDVLAGETRLINAQSDAASAEADVGIAAFSLLKSVGALDVRTLPQ